MYDLPTIVTHGYNPSTMGAEVGALQNQWCELSQKKETKQNRKNKTKQEGILDS
jgi:hypothetical protein